jgi:hypothetical protein
MSSPVSKSIQGNCDDIKLFLPLSKGHAGNTTFHHVIVWNFEDGANEGRIISDILGRK